jgi:hypothetical protein
MAICFRRNIILNTKFRKYIDEGKGTPALTYFIAVLQLLEQSYFCHHLVHFALFKN